MIGQQVPITPVVDHVYFMTANLREEGVRKIQNFDHYCFQ